MTMTHQTLRGKLAMTFCLIVFGLICALAIADKASAHGYMTSPASRSLLCSQAENQNCGAIQYEPQSVEGIGGFPASGPADGKLAGAGHYAELDQQSANRWKKVDLKGGSNTFTWTLTANHITEKWDYYITKIGWDPSKPLTRDQLESKPFCTIDGGNKQPSKSVSHTCNVPTDRTGYHIILGVWEIGDTVNAFYQAVDVNLSQGGTTPPPVATEPPSVPDDVWCSGHTDSSITMSWSASTSADGINHYEVIRDGKVIGTSKGLSYTDNGLPANTTYSYAVAAIDQSGRRSAASLPVSANTLPVLTPAPDTSAPTRPAGLRAGNVTDKTAALSWTAASDNIGVTKYEVYRDGKLIGTTTSTAYSESGLSASTSYSYTVVALDAANNRSAASAALALTTKAAPVAPPTNPTTAWDGTKVYVAGDIVSYNGIEYKASWWTQNERPDSSDVWKPVSGSAAQSWNGTKAYNGGDIVVYEGHTYKAKWWTKGDKPGQAGVWTLIA
ncbi:lytic polysaccharide monooxygenase [Paenibacillus sp. strain BS8-2]